MNEHDGPVYEVTLSIDREEAHDVDEWLESHVQRMLDVPGIVSARSYTLDDQDERVRRVTCYLFESDAHLENYLAEQAAELRQHTVDRFGDRFTASRRVLRTAGAAPAPIQHCLNCDALLTGQYCGTCGQRSTSRLISIWELVRDAFGDLFELDSRLWQTLIPLAVRPGRLTREYLQGRRARFMPPFRMYIVLSLVFFLVAFFDPREDLGLLFEPEPPADVGTDQGPSAADLREEIREELVNEGVIVDTDSEDDSGLNITIDGESVDGDCDFDDYDPDQMPDWMARRLTKERLQLACERIFTEGDEGLRGFFDRLVENIPVGLFILLPVMALVLKVLYPLSRRYYVEHLLFVLHYHAFIFLALSVQILFSRLTGAVGLLSILSGVTTFAITVYIPVYLYKAQRRVYAQGRLLTLAKLILLLFSYSVGLALILVFSALFAAFSA